MNRVEQIARHRQRLWQLQPKERRRDKLLREMDAEISDEEDDCNLSPEEIAAAAKAIRENRTIHRATEAAPASVPAIREYTTRPSRGGRNIY